MGNCSGVKIDLKYNEDGDQNEIQAYNNNSINNIIKNNNNNIILNQIDNEDDMNINQMINKIKEVEELNEKLLTEGNEITNSLQSFNLEEFRTYSSSIHQQNEDYKDKFSNRPSIKHTQMNKIPQKYSNDNIASLKSLDKRLQETYQKNRDYRDGQLSSRGQQGNKFQDILSYYESGEERNNDMRYKQIKVYSKLVGEIEEENKSQRSQKSFLEDTQYYPQKDYFNFESMQNQKNKNNNNYIPDEQGNETESDGNYEGSEEENVKLKEKLIDNLFSDRLHRNKQLTIIDDADESEAKSPEQKKQQQQQNTPSNSSHLSRKGGKGNNIKDIQKKNSLKIKNYPVFAFQGGSFQGEVTDSKRNGIGQQTFLDETVYMGQWKNDKRNGRGVQIWPDDTMYEGEWQNDIIQGIGKIEYGNRSYYIGEWKDNKFHGKGRFQHFSGAYYEGFWHLDLQHGKGVEVQLFPHYSRYEGIFEFSKKQGKGRLLIGNGSSYKGDFSNNNVHGLGVYHWANGVIYEGRWENNKMSGSGKMTWPNNIVYQGEFKNDQKSGIGFIEYEDGSKYIGEWKADKQDGKGTFYFKKNHSQIKGIWEKGKIITITSYFVQRNNQTNIIQANGPNRKKTVLIPLPPHNMFKSVNQPMYYDLQMPENLSSQRSLITQDNNQKPSLYKNERLISPTNKANNKHLSGYNNHKNQIKQSFSLKIPNEKK